MIEAGEYEDVVSKWAAETKRRWEKSKFVKLWEEEMKAARDPRKAFKERDGSRNWPMTTTATTPAYSHTQKAPLCLILYGSALACVVLAWIVGGTPGIFIAGGVSLLIALLAPCFHHLTVEDQGDVLAIRFGPIPLFRRTVRYTDIKKVEVGRTLILDGWGIHLSIRGGWVWNLWGRACVVVHYRNGGVLRIGTDDAEKLAGFLEGKVLR